MYERLNQSLLRFPQEIAKRENYTKEQLDAVLQMQMAELVYTDLYRQNQIQRLKESKINPNDCVIYSQIITDIERISDHAINIAEYSGMITEKKIVFSKFAQAELGEMQKICDQTFEILLNKQDDMVKWHEQMAAMEQKIDDLTEQYRNNMYERIQTGVCSDEGSILFSEMLTDFERIGDHVLNISSEMLKIAMVEK